MRATPSSPIIFFHASALRTRAAHAAVLVFDDIEIQDINRAEIYGRPAQTVLDIVRSADLLWNIASTIHPPFLSRFRRKALIDVDPGHLQILATQFEFGLKEHDVHLSVGANLPDPGLRGADSRSHLADIFAVRLLADVGSLRPVPAATRRSPRSRNGPGKSFRIRAAR